MNSGIDISLLLTFHAEGILAHSTLKSVERCREYANAHGISTEYIFVLDDVDEETRKVLRTAPIDNSAVKTIEVAHKDLGAARNSGVEVSRGKAIAILDGDDYFSKNWIERAWHYLHEFGPDSIMHPEFVINFGIHSAYCWQVDQAGKYFDADGLLLNNYWTSWTLARRDVYEDIPYVRTRPESTGFGFEDWHWNCETVSKGYKHRLAWGSVGFYRRKSKGLLAVTANLGVTVPPTNLFALDSKTKERL